MDAFETIAFLAPFLRFELHFELDAEPTTKAHPFESNHVRRLYAQVNEWRTAEV